MNRAPTWVRPAANGRADHPWSAAVEQGCSTLPRDSGRHAVAPLPKDRRMRCHRIPTRYRLGQHVVLSLP